VSKFIRTLIVAAIVNAGAAVPASASPGVRLETTALADGFTYEWLPNGSGVTLLRPGLHIVIFIGQRMYDVNNATPIADVAPVYDGRDILVSPALAAHLGEIARAYASRSFDDGQMVPYLSSPAAPPRASVEPAKSVPITVFAKQIVGRYALEVHGTGPAGAFVTLRLDAELSRDVPVVTLSRTSVQVRSDGSFASTVSYDQDPHFGTTLIINALSDDAISTASMRFVVGVPSPQITSSGLDAWPKS
jgi:hypothetical protein